MPLQRATFIRLASDLVTEAGRLAVQYNPAEFTLTKRTQYAEIGIPGLDMPVQQFVRGQAETLSFELFFDTTEHGMGEEAEVQPVTILTDQFYQLIRIDSNAKAPPVCRFIWATRGFPGSNLQRNNNQLRANGFQGILESVTQNFTLFSPLGVPLRATISVQMREYQTLAQQVEALNHSTEVSVDGQTLDQVASREYNDPTKWREIADFNGIEDPLNVLGGTLLDVPPL